MTDGIAGEDRTIPPLVFPRELTDAVREVLGLMIFTSGPIAHAYRVGGHDIRHKAEDEQAFVLHRYLVLALEHGRGWRRIASDEIRALQAELQRTSGEPKS